jgi:RNA polymerase sigma factor (sigma-70 family)
VDYKRLAVDSLPLLDEVVRFIARRHRLSADDADELAAAARLKLIENNYEVLRRFRGRSSIRTFLATVIRHQFLDLRNARWGKWRPSVQARRLGPLAIELEGLVTRDRLPVAAAVELLVARSGGPTRQELQRVACQLPRRSRRRFLGVQDLVRVGGGWSEDDVIRGIDGRSTAHRIEQALRAALDRLEPGDRMLLRMRYHSGCRVSRIAKMLELPQKALYRRFDTVFGVLRDELEARGVKAGDVEVLVGHPATEFAALFGEDQSGKRRGGNLSKDPVDEYTFSRRAAKAAMLRVEQAESHSQAQIPVSI